MKNFLEYLVENAGHDFEKDFKLALEHAAQNLNIGYENKKEKQDVLYIDEATKLLQYLKDSGVKKISNISLDGGKNNKRSVFEQNGTEWKFITPDKDVGKILSDITLKTDIGDIYLSLKAGNTLAFNNTGIGKYKQSDVENGRGSIGWFLKKCVNNGVSVDGTGFEKAYVQYFSKYRTKLLTKFIKAYKSYKDKDNIVQTIKDIIFEKTNDNILLHHFSDFINNLIGSHANEKGYSIIDIFAYYLGESGDDEIKNQYYVYLGRTKPHGYMNGAVRELFGKPSKNNILVKLLYTPNNSINIDMFNIKTEDEDVDHIKDDKKISSLALQATDFNLDIFKKCIKAAIGFGYIYVHLDKGNVYFIDFRNEEPLNKIVDNISNIHVNAPDAAKRIDLYIISDYIENISLTFRNVNSSIFPNKMLLQYSGFTEKGKQEL